MNRQLLKPEVQGFIHDFDGAIDRLAFSGSPFKGISTQQLLQQIVGRRRIAKKLPGWYEKSGILYPPKINLEQCSSEQTATYKAGLSSGKTAADLTGGFGVDSYYLSKKFEKVYYFETDESLYELAKNNFKEFGVANVELRNSDGIQGLSEMEVDLAFVDPSRRNLRKGKVVLLEDCRPDLTQHLEVITNHSREVLVKLSPMFDISIGIKALKSVREVHVVSVRNEVKELLFLIDTSYTGVPEIIAVDLNGTSTNIFRFEYGQSLPVSFSDPLNYLYEPMATIMKSGGFAVFGKAYGLSKLSVNSHLFTSEQLIDCPARIFRVLKSMPFNKRELKKEMKGNKAHLSVRNFPVSVDELRKKLGVKEGGNTYIFFTTNDKDERIVIFCEKAVQELKV